MNHAVRDMIKLVCWSFFAAVTLSPAQAQDPELVPQLGHSYPNSADFCGDGSTILTRDSGSAILWDKASGRQLRRYAGHTAQVWDAALSADGSRIITGSWDETAIVWDRVTGRRIRSFRHDKYNSVTAVALSPNGRLAAAGSIKGNLVIWNVETGRRHTTLAGHTDSIQDLVFTADGSHLLSASEDKSAILWDVQTGRLVHKLQANNEIRSVALSPNGNFALGGTMSRDSKSLRFVDGSGTLILWDIANGKRLTSKVVGNGVFSVAFSPDKDQLLCSVGVYHGSEFRRKMQLRDAKTLTLLKSFEYPENPKWKPASVAFSPDGREALSAGRPTVLWNLETAQPVKTIEGRNGYISSVDFVPGTTNALLSEYSQTNLWNLSSGRKLQEFAPPSGDYFLDDQTISADGNVFAAMAKKFGDAGFEGGSHLVVWDAKSGRQFQFFEVSPKHVSTLEVNADGTRAAIKSNDAATLWDLRTGKRLQRWGKAEHGRFGPRHVAISANGRRILTASTDKGATLWDAETGREIRSFGNLEWIGHVDSVAFSPDGRLIVAGVTGESLVGGQYELFHACVVWEANTGRQVSIWRHSNDDEGSDPEVAFSPDGRYVLTFNEHSGTRVVEVRTGKTICVTKLHTLYAVSPVFSGDSQYVCALSSFGTASFIEIATGREVVRFIQMDEGKNWLAVTPRGLFDGSTAAREAVAFRIGVGLNVVPADRFFQDFYHPGLLQSILKGDRPTPEIKLGESLPPELRILSPRAGVANAQQATIEVEATDKGGGVSSLAIYHNGARVLAPGETHRDGDKVVRTFQVALVEGSNRLQVKAASGDGSWESEPAQIVLNYEEPLDKSELYVLAIGINKYADANLNLNYAAKDARALANLFEERGGTLYEKVHVTQLLDEQATKSGIKKSLKKVAAQTRPQDTLVLFLAGHGTMVGQRYYFVPHELRKQADLLEDDIRQQGLPSDELSDYLGSAKALKRMLILDTCSSGGALGMIRKGRSGFALRGAVERLSRTHGLFTIAAASATDEAQESKELGHGVLSYALLAGLKAVDAGPLAGKYVQPSSPERVVDVMEWFTFAAGQVPRLTQRLYGESQDVQTSTQGSSFPVLPLEN